VAQKPLERSFGLVGKRGRSSHSFLRAKQWRRKTKFFLVKIFDFRRATVFCLGYRLSEHKITRYAKNLGALAPLATPMVRSPNLSEFETNEVTVSVSTTLRQLSLTLLHLEQRNVQELSFALRITPSIVFFKTSPDTGMAKPGDPHGPEASTFLA